MTNKNIINYLIFFTFSFFILSQTLWASDGTTVWTDVNTGIVSYRGLLITIGRSLGAIFVIFIVIHGWVTGNFNLLKISGIVLGILIICGSGLLVDFFASWIKGTT